jgi:hypothetical protein
MFNSCSLAVFILVGVVDGLCSAPHQPAVSGRVEDTGIKPSLEKYLNPHARNKSQRSLSLENRRLAQKKPHYLSFHTES